ncbi:DDB1- and CUL4-associated factor 1-like [Paramacrobiotus metropolitanus]|uniref:DDB1- and CUL4-associated factor 1-like n=1 Tax=Paramacrobiotus metropolitanus TaxID=2943436 RepID=UPI002445DC68|nr:DDB1- and CUL4-associated factor 1-like [Paramacrobiotus metropolitanus]
MDNDHNYQLDADEDPLIYPFNPEQNGEPGFPVDIDFGVQDQELQDLEINYFDDHPNGYKETRASKRTRAQVPENFRNGATACMEQFVENVRQKVRSPLVTENMKKLCELIQESFEEYLGLHRDPTEDINSVSVVECPKLHFLLEKFGTIHGDHDSDEEISEFYKTLAKHFVVVADDADMQYYGCVILYSVMQGFWASSPEYAKIFFENEIFFPFMHFMHTNPPGDPVLRLPARHQTEIRAILCGLYGTLFERATLEDFTVNFGVIRKLLPGHLSQLRSYIATLKPSEPSDARPEPPPVFSTPNVPTTSQRSGTKRRLDRTKSVLDSGSSTPSSSRRKKAKLTTSTDVVRLNIDETSSSSSWAEYERHQIGELSQNFRILPTMDEKLEIRLTLDLLVGLASVRDFDTTFQEVDVLGLCFDFLDARKKLTIRVMGQAIHLLANLVRNSRFGTRLLETPLRFIQMMKIPKPSIPSVFVVKLFAHVVSSSEYALETMVKYPDLVQNTTAFMVEYGLQSGHESARKWAAKFFIYALKFRAFIDTFDEPKVDGLRTLLNMIGRYDYLWQNELERQLSDEEQLMSASDALHLLYQVLNCYFTTDMIIKAEWFRQDLLRRARENKKEIALESKFPRIAPNKVFFLEKEEMDDLRDFLLAHVPLCRIRTRRDRILRFVQFDGVTRLLRLLELDKFTMITNREFTVVPFHKIGLEILEKCVLSKCAQDAIISYTTSDQSFPYTGFGMLIDMSVKYSSSDTSDVKKSADTAVKKSALDVLCNCIFGMRTGKDPEESELTESQGKSRPFYNDPEHFKQMVNIFRRHKCVEMMRRVIHEAEDPEEELLRTLACKILTGMAASPSCRQVMRELSFFRSGEIQVLMREPLTIDGSKEFANFEKAAKEMLEAVFETKLRTPIPPSLPEAVLRQDILRRTRITFSSQEIDLLLLDHLENRGLNTTANCLKSEAGLNEPSSVVAQPTKAKSRRSIYPSLIRVGTRSINVTGEDSNGGNILGQRNFILDATDASTMVVPGYPDLVGIVANNFRSEHAQCEYPIAVCPPFSLKKRHRCPNPVGILNAPYNISQRLSMRGGRGDETQWGRSLDRRYIFGKLRPVCNFGLPADAGVFDPEGGLLSAAFMGVQQNKIVTGTMDGYVVGYNISEPSKPTFYRACHEFECETHHLAMVPTFPACDVFVSCCSSISSTLWKLRPGGCDVIKQYPSVEYMTFPHFHDNIALGCEMEQLSPAYTIDLETGNKILTFSEPKLQGRYVKNRPSFHPSDDMVTHDGLLFDARSGKLIHQFDQFERHTSNGVFHPDGNVIIIDEQVWDLRTFKLRKSVMQLRQSLLKFNATGDVLYAVHYEKQVDDLEPTVYEFPGGFTTVDSKDYSTIAGIDLKRKFQCLTLDTLDNHIFLGESYSESLGAYGRLFQIGVDKGDEEEDLEKTDDEDDDHFGDDDDDDDDEEDMTAIFDDDYGDEMDWEEVEDDDAAPSPENEEDEWTTDEEAGNNDDDNDDDDVVYEVGNHVDYEPD